MLGLLVLTVVLVAVIMAAMSVGALFSNRCLRGSCGAPEVLGPDGMPLTCETCPLRNRSDDRSGTPTAPSGRADFS